MIRIDKLASITAITVSAISLSYAHLPSMNSTAHLMGRTGNVSNSGGITSRAEVTYSNKGEWKPDGVYRGDYTIAQGDTVWYGEFNGKKLWWWAKFYASGEGLKPGSFAPQGGTSPWVLINSLSATGDGNVNYEWKGLNGQMDKMSGLDAQVPTWRDGAEGAYSFTHDDIGAMPFDLSVRPGWDVAKEFPDIKQCWGIYVEKMNPADWNSAIEMVLDGHEMFNHSMEHTSAADQWQWFRPGQVIPTHDPAIPEEIRGLTVVGTWGNPAEAPAYPVKTGGTKIFESPMVAIEATHYWTQNAPTSEQPGDTLKEANGSVLKIDGQPWVVIEPQIYPKDGVQEITLPSGQRQFVKYTKRDETGEGKNEGYIAATGATWMELAQLDEYGGQFWQPASPAIVGEPPVYSGQGYGISAGSVFSHNGAYYRCLVDNPYMAPDAKDWEGNNPQWEQIEYDSSQPILDTNGSYVGPKWSSSTQYVGPDKGAPAFVAKVFCVEAWKDDDYRKNIREANDMINKNIYDRIVTAGEHFRKGKVSEYYGYPFDAYSEVTHDSLEQAGFVGARGGAKSGRPIPGDFFHPYRIDFDAFYITKEDWTPESTGEGYIYPDNPHVLLGLNEMVDKIIDEKGYMIREFHSVADIPDGEWYDLNERSEYWPLNSSAKGVGGWWGGITSNQLREHYTYVQKQIDANKITVYTVGEVTKYRMTANAVSGATVTKSGDNYTLDLQILSAEQNLPAKYRDEISVIVSLDQAVDSLGVNYTSVDDNWGASPRRRPRMMDTAGKLWSVSINPFLGSAEIVPNGDWNGQDIEVKDPTSVTTAVQINKKEIAFTGIRSGEISLNLPKGKFTVELHNALGRKIGSADVNGVGGIVRTGLSTSSYGKGIYFMSVKAQNQLVMPATKILIQ